MEGIDQKQSILVKGKDGHLVRLEVSVQASLVVVPILLCEMFHERADTGKDTGIGELLP